MRTKQNTISQSYKGAAETPQDFVSKMDQNIQKDDQTMYQENDNHECHLYEELCATAMDFQLLVEVMKKNLSMCRDDDYRSAERLSCHLCNTLNLRYSDIDRLKSFLNSLSNGLCIVGEKGPNGTYSLGEIIYTILLIAIQKTKKKMNRKQHDNLIIGEFDEYEDTRLISFGALKKIKWFHSIDQYTNLTRFKYDPFTGEKIDWEKLKEDYDSTKI